MIDWEKLWEEPERRPPPVAPMRSVTIPEGGDRYAQAALAGEIDNLRAATEGFRNRTLNNCSLKLYELVAANRLDDQVVHNELRSAALAIGLEPTEIEKTIASGRKKGLTQPRQVAELEVTTNVTEVPFTQLAGEVVVTDEDDDEEVTRTTWWPVPIGERAAQDATIPPPTHLVREDGVALLYSGKINGLLGESESGKSWVALLAVVQAIGAGERVLFLDFEDSPASIKGRLDSMGATVNLGGLDYTNPSEGLGALQSRDLAEALAGGVYTLIVVDGVNAAMTLLGYDINSNTDATLFAQKLLAPLASTGACVLTVDHVPKNTEQRGRGGIGAQAKRAMMSGCALTVEVVEPFGRGQAGVLKLTVDKDRPGHVRGASAGSKFAGRAHLDSVGDQVRMRIEPPMAVAEPDKEWLPTGVMEKVSRLLERADEPMSGRDIREAIPARAQTVIQAVAELVAGGFIAHEKRSGRGGGEAYTSVRMYQPVSLRYPELESDLVPTPPLPTGGVPVHHRVGTRTLTNWYRYQKGWPRGCRAATGAGSRRRIPFSTTPPAIAHRVAG